MFALTQGAGMDFGFPDCCETYEGVLVTPIPYPNINESATNAPAAYTVLMDCMPTVNQLTFGTVSEGDELGILLGVISFMESGETIYLLGNLTIMAEGIPVQRLTSVTGQNCLAVLLNSPGMTICPSQVTVLTLG